MDSSAVVVTMLRDGLLGDRGSLLSEAKILSLPQNVQPPTQCVPGALSPALKRPWCEGDHSPPSNVGIKIGGAIPPSPHTPSRYDMIYLTAIG